MKIKIFGHNFLIYINNFGQENCICGTQQENHKLLTLIFGQKCTFRPKIAFQQNVRKWPRVMKVFRLKIQSMPSVSYYLVLTIHIKILKGAKEVTIQRNAIIKTVWYLNYYFNMHIGLCSTCSYKLNLQYLKKL